MSDELSRRGFLRETAMLGAAAAAMRAAEGATGAETSPGELPKIRLGSLEVSRLILGSNPFFGYAHHGELGRKMIEYYKDDQRIMDVLAQAAELGITTVTAPPMPRWIKVFNKYLDGGGKLRIWIAQPHGEPEQMTKEITTAVRGGAKAAFIQGCRVEQQFRAGKMEVLRGWVEHIKSYDIPAGMAAHQADIHPLAEKANFPTDFYYQCFYRGDIERYVPEDRDLAVATIRQITHKPVVAYKILAASRLPAKEGFQFAFRHLAAKDGACVGIYPPMKAGMLAEDVGLAKKLSKS
jgi:hypothetical protein